MRSAARSGIIWIDNPPVNAISLSVRVALMRGVAALSKDPQIAVGVLACKGRTFMAGADITEFGRPFASPDLHETIDAIEACPKSIVAAIHGSALGGGLEVALACHYRVAVPQAQIGLPEVKLGILPGAGGTQRLPRLLGVEAALALMLSGDPMPAVEAAAGGVIDRIIEGDLFEGAIAFAAEVAAFDSPARRVRDRAIEAATLPPGFFATARARLAREKKNLFAPQRIVDAVEAATALPYDEGIVRERELFARCMQSSQAGALQHVFFAERKAANIPSLDKAITRPVDRIAVIGAGTMGGGIAMSFLNAGIPVTLLEMNAAALERGVALIHRNYENSAFKGRLTQSEVQRRQALLNPTLSYADLGDADLIIEAVFETLAVKKEVFGHMDAAAKPGAILASNTSYLSIDEIALATSRPADVLGTHFFSPANIMRLLEIVRGARTAPDALATLLGVAKRIKKIGVVAGNCDGFIGNRMLGGYAHQALLLLLEGAQPEQIDGALRGFGMPMGLLQMSDLAGLDVTYKSRQDRDPDSYDGRVWRSADLLVEMGRLGQKTKPDIMTMNPVIGHRVHRPW